MKRLVNVYVPAIDEAFDVRIPSDMSIGTIKKLIAESIEKMSSGRYVASGGEILSDIDKKKVLREDKTFSDNDIKEGEHLMLL